MIDLIKIINKNAADMNNVVVVVEPDLRSGSTTLKNQYFKYFISSMLLYSVFSELRK